MKSDLGDIMAPSAPYYIFGNVIYHTHGYFFINHHM